MHGEAGSTQPGQQHPQPGSADAAPTPRRFPLRFAAWLWRRSRAVLPMDSDLEVSRNVAGVPVPIRIRPSFVGLVVLGGALGAAARFVLVQLAPSWETLSAGTVAVNLLGPFMLGVLLQSLAEGEETDGRRTVRLLVGTGFLGAFTSYAQLAVDVVVVAGNGLVLLAGVYAAATIASGAAVTWLGIYLAAHRRLFMLRRLFLHRRLITHRRRRSP